MAVMKRTNKDGTTDSVYTIYFRPFKTKKIGLKLGTTSKREAESIEVMILKACRTGNYTMLDDASREACIRMFQNQKWEIPAALTGHMPVSPPNDELTLWKAIELTLKYPDVRNNPNRERMQQAFTHVVEHFGRDYPVKMIRTPHVKQYQIERLNEGAAASTVNKERAALSRLFQVLIELELCTRNFVRETKGADERDGRREVYVSFEDFNSLAANLPAWMKPIARTLYFTGMRRKEALELTWANVNLESRIIRLHAHQTKERQVKRIPIHRLLVPILESVGKVRSIATDRIFLIRPGEAPCEDSLRKPWNNACRAGGLKPAPTLRDIRHVWKSNAMKSGMDFEIREAIMGHSRGIAGRYGRISDEDLVRAVDRMRFDNGKTEIWIARPKKEKPAGESCRSKNGNKMVTKSVLLSVQKQGALC